MRLFTRTYDGESIYDVVRDISDVFDEDYNPFLATIPKDESEIHKGTFLVTVTWEDN